MSVQGCGAQSGDRRGDCCKSEPTEPVGVSPTHLEERFLVPAVFSSSRSQSSARREIRGRRQCNNSSTHLTNVAQRSIVLVKSGMPPWGYSARQHALLGHVSLLRAPLSPAP